MDHTHMNYRHGASQENMFPPERRGSLCGDTLRKHGMSAERLRMPDGKVDCLFFLQLIRPIYDPKRSTIKDDGRLGYYFPVSKWSNGYANDLGLGCGHGHKFDQVSPWEVVKFDGVLTMDGVVGGSKGAIYRRWDPDSEMYNKKIDDNFSITRFNDMRRVIKLCDDKAAPKKGQPKYNPAYKYDFAFRSLVHTVNYFTERAELDSCADESAFPYNGYGEKETGLIVRLRQKKPGVTKGGQLVMIKDVHRIRPRAYAHRHKMHKKSGIKGGQGANEVVMLLDQVEEMLITAEMPEDHPNRKRKGIFTQKPHVTWDNYFSGDGTMEYCATNGYGMTCTVARNRLPAGIPGVYFHKEGTDTGLRSKSCRYLQPIVVSKEIAGSTCTIASFQSTSSCNILSINAFDKNSLYVEARQCGKGKYKRTWAIEMNEARKLYLGSYGAMDRIDHLLKNCGIFFRSLKYWHAGMTHAQKMAIVVAYDIYLEICEGFLDPNWVDRAPIDFYEFREQLARQMLTYDPRQRQYPGDNKFRPSTQQPKSKRPPEETTAATPPARKRAATDTGSGISIDQIKKNGYRFCGDLGDLINHQKSVTTLRGTNTRACAVCGKQTRHVCRICDSSLHFDHKYTNEVLRVTCFLQWHNFCFFGKAREDRDMMGIKLKEFGLPDSPEQQQHAALMRQYMSESSSSGNNSTTTTATPSTNNNTTTHQTPTRARTTRNSQRTPNNNNNNSVNNNNNNNNNNQQQQDSDDSDDDLYGSRHEREVVARAQAQSRADDDERNNPHVI